MEKLNQKQKQLVNDNHNLIYGYVHKHNLNLDEYYDILALALCKAALKYHGAKSQFQTFAYACFGNAVANHMKENSCDKRTLQDGEKFLWLDEPYSKDTDIEGQSTIGQHIPSKRLQPLDVCEGKIMADVMMSQLSEAEQEIVRWKMDGLNDREIADLLSCTHQNVHHRVKKIRRKLSSFIS